MRSSSTDRAPEGRHLVLTLRGTDRAGWVRLVVAVLLGVVAALAPQVGSTSAQFTGTDEATLTVTTAESFGVTPAQSQFLTPTRPNPPHGHTRPPWKRHR